MTDRSRVSVVVTTFNHAHFLAEALSSIMSQTRPADEIIVVDDGSSDDPAAVVDAFPSASLIRQDNRGLSAARNAGLRAATGEFILFLDADDRLLPEAVALGLRVLADNGDAVLAYGAHRRIDASGRVIGGVHYLAALDEAKGGLLRLNRIGMHATVLYRTAALRAVRGFDEGLRRCEDYDAYLRLSTLAPITSHPHPVAEYRIHGDNMSHDHRAMNTAVLQVHARHCPGHGAAQAAWNEGRRAWRSFYADQALNATGGTMLSRWLGSARIAPAQTVRRAGAQLLGDWRRLVPRLRRRFSGSSGRIPWGTFRFGDLAAATPVSDDFGWDRGEPIDRRYIERFLEQHAHLIRGRVLEIGDDAYSRRFGGAQVTQQDILHRKPVPEATIVGDLSVPGTLPEAAFDAIVLTQTLHLIYDMPAALAELKRALRPGGTLLLTVPGITPIDRKEWRDSWYWSLTETGLRRMIDDVFGSGCGKLGSYGNVYAACCLLQGLAIEEVDHRLVDVFDPAFPVVVWATVRRVA